MVQGKYYIDFPRSIFTDSINLKLLYGFNKIPSQTEAGV